MVAGPDSDRRPSARLAHRFDLPYFRILVNSHVPEKARAIFPTVFPAVAQTVANADVF